ncbi:MAG: gliding motility-associated C-terminal domain-containing protein [Saprospiraceae bacterium]|nr:gliding motility-associated C-terminal domain-containing protein [Saprospiraceae bacterium]
MTCIRFDSTPGLATPAKLRPTADGRLLLSTDMPEPALLEFNSNGALLRARRIRVDGPQVPQLLDAWEIPGGADKICLIAQPQTNASGQGSYRIFIKRYTSDFKEQWSIYLGLGPVSGIGEFCRLIPDQVGNFYAWIGNSSNNIVLRFAPSGAPLWLLQIPDNINGAALAGDGGVLLSTHSGGNDKPGLLHLGPDGKLAQAIRIAGNTSISGFQLNSFPGGDILLSWTDSGNGAWVFARLSPQLTAIRAWSLLNVSSVEVDNVVVTNDSLLYAFKFEGGGSLVFQLNGSGTVLQTVLVPDLVPQIFLGSPPAPLGPDGWAIASVSSTNPHQLVLTHLDASMSLPDCPLERLDCLESMPANVEFEADNPQLQHKTLPLSYLQAYEWEGFSPSVEAYCPVTAEPNARFLLPDTICVGTYLTPDSLNNNEATGWHWNITDGSSSGDSPQPSLYFGSAGTWQVSQQLRYWLCQEDSFSRSIVVLPAPELELGPDTTVCQQDNYSITATVHQATAWAWEDQSTSLLRVVEHSGLFALQASNGICTTRDSVQVDMVWVNASFAAPDSLCLGASFSPSPANTPTGTEHWWMFSPPVLPVFNTENPGIAVPETGIFRLTHQVESAGCRDTAEQVLCVLEVPEVWLDSSLGLCQDSLFFLVPDTTAATTFQWSDGYPTLNRTITTGGIFTLLVSNGVCQVSASVEIQRYSCQQPEVYIPNAIAPEHGGENAVFQVFFNAGVERVESLEIFDRWGSLVFQSFDGSGWDGQFRGHPAPVGVYVWKLQLALADGGFEWRSGSVSLLR